jgi:predicted RNA-binding protein YlxR (DUF448 family)
LRNPPNDTDHSRVSKSVRVERSRDTLSSEGETGASAALGMAPRLRSGRTALGDAGQTPERTCILTRDAAPRDDLIRLAVSPDGEVLPDVRAKAPGRGAWLGVDRAALGRALANGKLKGALSRAFKTADIRIPADLPERIEAALRQSALDRLGLEARSGTLLSGSEKIEAACRKGEAVLLLHAADAGEDGNRKLDQAWRVGGQEGQGLVIPAGRAILSLALGRQNVVHIALIDRGAAARVGNALARWRAFIGPDSGLSAASAGQPDASAVDVNEGL